MNMVTKVFIDFNEEIQGKMEIYDFHEYIIWYFDETDEDMLIRDVRQLLIDEVKLDVLLYDMDLTYRGFILNVCKLYPNILTPHIIKQVRAYIEENDLS